MNIESLYTSLRTITDIFNTRELAIGTLTIAFFIWMALSKDFRKSLSNVVKTIFTKKIMLSIFTLGVYFVFIIYLLYKTGFWNITLLKPTIISFFTVAIVSMAQALTKAKDSDYFKNIIRENLTIILILEFLLNIYTLSFRWEVLFILLITSSSIVIAILDACPEFSQPIHYKMKKELRRLIGLIVTIYMLNSVNLIIENRELLEIEAIVKEFFFLIILVITLIPFNYLYTAYSKYEMLFIRLSFKRTIASDLRRYLYLKVFLTCKLDLKLIDEFIPQSGVMSSRINSKNDVLGLITEFQSSLKSTQQL